MTHSMLISNIFYDFKIDILDSDLHQSRTSNDFHLDLLILYASSTSYKVHKAAFNNESTCKDL